ncbi:MAG: hypothetical protein GY847_12675 [Proteobacteria bacterium]|nr:hypothetical protein [Pseudomonadota bacterium]
MVDSKSPPGSNDVLIHPAAIDRWPRGIACEGGFRILGTPIGFGNTRGASLKFLSHMDEAIPERGRRVLCTPFIAAAIGTENRGLDTLTLGYDRKIRLGRMDIRLLPAGLGPGSAQLEVSFRDRRIVFSRGVRLAGTSGAALAVEIPTCDLLLLDTAPAEPRPPSPKRVSARIVDWVNNTVSAGEVPVLCAGSFAAAIDTAWALRHLDIKVRACRSLFEMLRRVQEAGYSMPCLRRLEQQLPRSGAVLHLSRLWADTGVARKSSAQVAYIGPGRAKPKWADVAFRLGEIEDRPGLVSYVQSTKASQVALGPSCDKTTSAMMQKAGINVYQVPDPTQMPLPF